MPNSNRMRELRKLALKGGTQKSAVSSDWQSQILAGLFACALGILLPTVIAVIPRAMPSVSAWLPVEEEAKEIIHAEEISPKRDEKAKEVLVAALPEPAEVTQEAEVTEDEVVIEASENIPDTEAVVTAAVPDTIKETEEVLTAAVPETIEGTTEPKPLPSKAQLAEAYTWSVRTKIEQLGLERYLKAEAAEDGELMLWGKITKRAMPQYEQFKTWYASKKAFPELRERFQIVEEAALFPQIRSVWLGSKPTVHFDNGQVASIGSRIGDGWEVVSIDHLAVKIRRDGETLTLSY